MGPTLQDCNGKGPLVLSTLKRKDGTSTTGWKESMKLLMEELLPDDREDDDEEIHETARRLANSEYHSNAQELPFTEEEVRTALMSMAKKKAPGPDKIKTEVLQKIQNKLIPCITRLICECLEQDKYQMVWKKSNLIILKKGRRQRSDPTKVLQVYLFNKYDGELL